MDKGNSLFYSRLKKTADWAAYVAVIIYTRCRPVWRRVDYNSVCEWGEGEINKDTVNMGAICPGDAPLCYPWGTNYVLSKLLFDV